MHEPILWEKYVLIFFVIVVTIPMSVGVVLEDIVSYVCLVRLYEFLGHYAYNEGERGLNELFKG
jgi:hypothetical protein